jgi:hypothetical protein
MRARAVLIGNVLTLVAADAAAMLAVGTHMIDGPYQGVRLVVCAVGAFLLARRSHRWRNAVLAVVVALASAFLAVTVSTVAYAVSGAAAAYGHGPGFVVAFAIAASAAGLASGAAGAGAGWLAHRWWPPRESAEPRRLAAGRRKFP